MPKKYEKSHLKTNVAYSLAECQAVLQFVGLAKSN
jgi:hypothetical protein